MTNRFSELEPSEYQVGGSRQDDFFEALSHPRRRFLLHALCDSSTPVPVDQLAAGLVAWEGQRPAPDRSDDDRDAIRISLVHSHLPKLAGAGLVDYDSARQTVAPAERTDEARAHLERVTSATTGSD